MYSLFLTFEITNKRFLFFAIYIFMPLTFTEAYIYYLCTSNTYNVGGILGNSVCIWKEIRLAKSFWANIQQNRTKRKRVLERVEREWEWERERFNLSSCNTFAIALIQLFWGVLLLYVMTCNAYFVWYLSHTFFLWLVLNTPSTFLYFAY